MTTRRNFIINSGLATTSLLIPGFLKATEQRNSLQSSNKVLIVLQLSGGNDGLNTVIPVRNDLYYKSRPKIGIDRGAALGLTDEISIHPELKVFKSLYDEGALTILNGVGYPNPDRSHFRSMDIWHTGSESSIYWNTGWLGRYLDAQCQSCSNSTAVLEIDDVLSLALKGEKMKGLAFKDPKRLYATSLDPLYQQYAKQDLNTVHNTSLHYLYKTLSETVSSTKYIYDQSNAHPSKSVYPSTEIGKSLKEIAGLIASPIDTKVYYVSHGSFDTHAGQVGQQQRLFKELNEALSVFVKDLKDQNRFNDVLIMSFSEFGRRVAENASGGTDHGTANNLFLIGGGLKQKGIYNSIPDLSNLDEGDLKYSIDFRNVYATILNKWLIADDRAIIKRRNDYLNFL